MYWNVLFHITAWKSNAPAGNKTKATGLYTRLKHQKGNDFPYTQQDHQTLPSMHSIWFFSMSACKTTLYFSTLFIEKIGVYKYIYICIYVYAYYVRILCTHIIYITIWARSSLQFAWRSAGCFFQCVSHPSCCSLTLWFEGSANSLPHSLYLP